MGRGDRQGTLKRHAGGLLALETGIAQHAALLELLSSAGLVSAESRQDLTKRDRYVFARAVA